MEKKVIIAGGTGFIGTYISSRFKENGYEVKIISRNGSINWGDRPGLIHTLENTEVLINLAGKSINCRFTEKNKNTILKSRVDTTRILGEAIQECTHPPALWINASTASVYGEHTGRAMTERDPDDRDSFPAEVARQWEKTFFSFRLPDTRQVAMRFGMVLGKNGGAIQPLMRLTRFGLGGRYGDGTQMISWVHVEDLFQMIVFIDQHKSISGIFNGTAPAPVTNRTFMKSMRAVMQVSIGIPAPKVIVKIGTFVIGTDPQLILEDLWALPERLLKMGFVFSYPDLRSALENCCEKKS